MRLALLPNSCVVSAFEYRVAESVGSFVAAAGAKGDRYLYAAAYRGIVRVGS
jgi:ATP-dependent protease ClpP protease subunit